MDVLTFRRARGAVELDEAYEVDVAIPVINGTPLHEMLGDRFVGLATVLVVPPSRHLLGAPSDGEDGRAAILDGECGVVGCCGVMARVDVGADVVRWSDFVARGRPELPDGLAFTFARSAYEAALAAVARAAIETLPVEG